MKRLYNFETGQWITVRPEILTGEGIPYALSGENGDLYLDKVSGNLYYKETGIWFLELNLTGPTGPIGPAGPTPLFKSGTFADSNVVINGDTVTISHDQGNIILPLLITDANGVGVPLSEDKIIFSNNLITLDLAGFTHSTSWRYAFGGGVDGIQTGNEILHVGISGKHGAYLVGGSAVVDNGNGTVTFEVYHCFLDDGDSIRIAHTVNYDGTYNIVSHMDGDYHPDTNPTGNKGTVTITATYVAETLPSGESEAVMQYIQPQSETDKLVSFLANHRNLDLKNYYLQITFDTGGYYDLGSEMLEITKVHNGAIKMDFVYEPPENDYAGATTYARNNKILTINSTNNLGTLYLHELQLYELRICYGVEFLNSTSQAVFILKSSINYSYIDACKFTASVPGSATENGCFYEAGCSNSLALSSCVFSGGSAWVRGGSLALGGPRFVPPSPFYGVVSDFRVQTSVAPTGAQTAAYRSKNGGSVYLNGVNKI